MTSKRHDEIVKQAQKRLSSEGRVIRLDSKIMPDLILISPDGIISAVEVELSHDGASEIKRNIEKYSDFDSVITFRLKKKRLYLYDFKAERYYPKRFFERVLELTKEGYSQTQIAKELQKEFHRPIPQSTISMVQNGHRKWSKSREKPEFKVVIERTSTKREYEATH